MSNLLKVYLAIFGSFVLFSFLDILDPIRRILFFAFILLTIFYAFKLLRRILKRFLWKIRRKLILSYIFIAFIPVCLIAVLFFMASFIFMGQTTSELFNSTLDAYLLQSRNEAEKILHLTEFLEPREAVERWSAELSDADREWLSQAEIAIAIDGGMDLIQGNTQHPLPGWAKERSVTGLILRDSFPMLATVRHDHTGKRTVQMLVPVSSHLLDLIRQKIQADITFIPFASEKPRDEFKATVGSSPSPKEWRKWWDFPIWWLSLPNQFDWRTGEKVSVLKSRNEAEEGQESENSKQITISRNKEMANVEIRMDPEDSGSLGAFIVSTHLSRVYSQVFSRSTALQKFVYALMFSVAVFFLIIELVSLISGFLLARSITASVHSLFEGTERIKKGDLDYRIHVSAKDQLGDLAASFNSMTESVKNLLKERAEKERLAESLRIARQMQQNLLPREVASLGGIEIATMNLPAQEVCGDYYDIIRRADQTMGVIVADVSGKGPSAALYMAEVKGVVLSISQRADTPRQLLLEANKILGPTLDPKSFITMTYAVIDEDGQSIRMSRAGHNPVLHFCAREDRIEIVQPTGIGLGLSRNGVFEQTLEEVERQLHSGDILVFYTDGLTEAMNRQSHLYGLDRLSQIVHQHKLRSSEQIKTAVMDDLQQFLDNELPQDDITLVLLKVVA